MSSVSFFLLLFSTTATMKLFFSSFARICWSRFFCAALRRASSGESLVAAELPKCSSKHKERFVSTGLFEQRSKNPTQARFPPCIRYSPSCCAIMRFFLLSLLVVFLVMTSALASNENFSQRRRRSKELEEKLNKLDTATKSRIHAMKASGMPKDAIADKIAYVAGDKATARRIVDALHDDPASRVKPTPPKKAPPQQSKGGYNAGSGSSTNPAFQQQANKMPTPGAKSQAKTPNAQSRKSQPNSMPINYNSNAQKNRK